LVPAVLNSSQPLKLFVLVACPCLAFLINWRSVSHLVGLLSIALGTLVPFLLLVQSGVCSASLRKIHDLPDCVLHRSVDVLLNVCLLSAALILATANEWRGSLPATINNMGLPRSIRSTTIVAGSMIGEFQRAMLRVHHAYTARGEAVPAIHWRNLVVLPRMLGAVWAAELNGFVERIQGQWSSDQFWMRYVPPISQCEITFRKSDLTVLVLGGAVLIGSIRSVLS